MNECDLCPSHGLCLGRRQRAAIGAGGQWLCEGPPASVSPSWVSHASSIRTPASRPVEMARGDVAP